MAKRKGKKRTSVAQTAPAGGNATENAVPQAKRPSAPRTRKRPRPSVQIVEIESDEGDNEVQPRLRGALRGLDPSAIIPPTQPSVEIDDKDDVDDLKGTQSAQHGTRQARHGKSEVNYDMKFHPMDVVTRPKRAARRVSASVLRDDDAETDEESLPSSAIASDNSSEGEDEGSSDEEEEIVQREPDPRATRRSKRATASSAVNYSMKNHPQDYALPGYRHKARKVKKKTKRAGRTVSHVAIPVTRTVHAMNTESNDVDEMLTSNELTESEVTIKLPEKRLKPQKSSPRKKLRTLEDEGDRDLSSRPGVQSTATETGSDIVHLLDNLAQSTALPITSEDVSTDTPMRNSRVEKQSMIASISKTSNNITTTPQDTYAHQIHRNESQKHSDGTENDMASDVENANDLPFPKFSAIRNEHNHDDAFMFDYEDNGHMQHTETSWNSISDSATNGIANSNGVASTLTEKDPQQDTGNESNHRQSDSTESMDFDRQSGHHSPNHPQHSHFEEQFAVTQTQEDVFEDLTTGLDDEHEPVSTLENHLHGDVICSEASFKDVVEETGSSDLPLPAEQPDAATNDIGSSDNQAVNSESAVEDDPILSELKAFLKEGSTEGNGNSDVASEITQVDSIVSAEEDVVIAESGNESHDVDSNDGEISKNIAESSARGTPETRIVPREIPIQDEDLSRSAKRSKSAPYLTPESLRDSVVGSRRRSLDALITEVSTHNVNDDDLLQSMRSSQHAQSDKMLRSDPAIVE